MSEQHRGYEEFFNDPTGYWAQYFFDEHTVKTEKQVNFLINTLHLSPTETMILDCPCGAGRHALALTGRGFNVTGLDKSAFLLEKAKERDSEGKIVEFLKQDMRNVPYQDMFDVVLNMSTSFGYFDTEAEDQEALHQMTKALKSGGTLVMDVINRDFVIRNYTYRNWFKLQDGTLVTIERVFNQKEGKNYEWRYQYTRDGSVKLYLTTLRMYTLPELKHMMEKEGLQVHEEVYGDFEGNYLHIDSPRYIIFASKT